jgi:hypothetical protein
LGQAKSAVLNSLTSADAQRGSSTPKQDIYALMGKAEADIAIESFTGVLVDDGTMVKPTEEGVRLLTSVVDGNARRP